MEQFAASVNKFLTFNDYKILPNRGRISAAQAKAKAEAEYDLFNPTQQIYSDFLITVLFYDYDTCRP